MGMPNLSAAWSILSRGSRKHAIHEEAGAALGDERQLVDRGDKGARLAHFLFARPLTAHHLDQRKLRDRIEEMQPDQAAGIDELARDVFETERRCVGRERRAGLCLLLELSK